MKYDLTKDTINKTPIFFGRGSTPLVSLEEAKQTTKNYFTKYYDFNTKLKQYIHNVDKCKDVFSIQQYIEYAAVKGLNIKTKINLSSINK